MYSFSSFKGEVLKIFKIINHLVILLNKHIYIFLVLSYFFFLNQLAWTRNRPFSGTLEFHLITTQIQQQINSQYCIVEKKISIEQFVFLFVITIQVKMRAKRPSQKTICSVKVVYMDELATIHELCFVKYHVVFFLIIVKTNFHCAW